jgi:hypothetical protein
MNKQVDVNVSLSISEQLKSDAVPDDEVDAFLAGFLGRKTDALDAEVVEDDS